MNKYVCFYKCKQMIVEADTSYHAQQEATRIFKAKHSYDVTVFIVAHEDGTEVVHTAID